MSRDTSGGGGSPSNRFWTVIAIVTEIGFPFTVFPRRNTYSRKTCHNAVDLTGVVVLGGVCGEWVLAG